MSQRFWLLLTWGFKKHPKHAINKSSSLDDSSQFTRILRTTSNKNRRLQDMSCLGKVYKWPWNRALKCRCRTLPLVMFVSFYIGDVHGKAKGEEEGARDDAVHPQNHWVVNKNFKQTCMSCKKRLHFGNLTKHGWNIHIVTIRSIFLA